ncbi:hypothetical protein [Bacillus sp. AFS029637]|nr:hypothetical protein [Bacillus sp. AFS029637]
MNKSLRIITIVGVLIPLVVIWNLPEVPSKEKSFLQLFNYLLDLLL